MEYWHEILAKQLVGVRAITLIIDHAVNNGSNRIKVKMLKGGPRSPSLSKMEPQKMPIRLMRGGINLLWLDPWGGYAIVPAVNKNGPSEDHGVTYTMAVPNLEANDPSLLFPIEFNCIHNSSEGHVMYKKKKHIY